MALIFQRLARNFIKNGYFPTDGLVSKESLTITLVKTLANTFIKFKSGTTNQTATKATEASGHDSE